MLLNRKFKVGIRIIKIQKLDLDSISLDCTAEERDGLKAMVSSAIETYGESDIDFMLPGNSSQREQSLKDFGADLEDFADDEDIILSRNELSILLIVVSESEGVDVPNLSKESKDSTTVRLNIE